MPAFEFHFQPCVSRSLFFMCRTNNQHNRRRAASVRVSSISFCKGGARYGCEHSHCPRGSFEAMLLREVACVFLCVYNHRFNGGASFLRSFSWPQESRTTPSPSSLPRSPAEIFVCTGRYPKKLRRVGRHDHRMRRGCRCTVG